MMILKRVLEREHFILPNTKDSETAWYWSWSEQINKAGNNFINEDEYM